VTVTRAVILARGLGTRMRAADPDVDLTAEQHRVASTGLKPMIPVHGRPFMDYILSGLADAGLTEVALVVAPDHEAVRRYYVREAPPSRMAVSFVVQPEALGTANALLAAEAWIAGHDFLVLNADNLYPTPALTGLVRLGEPGLLAFDRDDLVRSSNIPIDRLQAFAFVDVDAAGYLTAIVEKPSQGRPDHPLISMNAWRFDARIFQPCRDVPRSARGEFELPEAVGVAVDRGIKLRALPAKGPVLDLSRRADARSVADHLRPVTPHP
jgi:dTDP-glucose pyrophosphorylase